MYIEAPVLGVSWKCTDGTFDGYGDTRQEAFAAYNEAKRICVSQPVPLFGMDGKRKHW